VSFSEAPTACSPGQGGTLMFPLGGSPGSVAFAGSGGVTNFAFSGVLTNGRLVGTLSYSWTTASANGNVTGSASTTTAVR
jgi:hypothetical protein